MDLDGQLNLREDSPPSAAVQDYLQSQDLQVGEMRLHHRFSWGVRKGLSPARALEEARLAQALHADTPEGQDRAALQAAIGREPIRLLAGQHVPLDENGDLQVLNLCEQAVWVASTDVRVIWQEQLDGKPWTLVIEDGGSQPRRRPSEERETWTVPVEGLLPEQIWDQLLDGEEPRGDGLWMSMAEFGRFPVGLQPPISEQALHAARMRMVLVELMQMYGQSEEEGEIVPIGAEEAELVVGLLDECLERFVARPRLALPCRDVVDLGPEQEWQQAGPHCLAALLDEISGDNPLLHGLLRGSESLRFGSLVLTGDPDHMGDDLLSATLAWHRCSLILRPEALERTLLFAGNLHPFAEIAVPELRFGIYTTLGLQAHLRDMLRARVYLALTPTTAESQGIFWNGREQQLEVVRHSPRPPFMALLQAVSAYRALGDEQDRKPLDSIISGTVSLALHQSLAQAEAHQGLDGVCLGELQLSDIEQVVLALGDEQEYQAYSDSQRMPEYLRPAARFFENQGIQLRLRPPQRPEWRA